MSYAYAKPLPVLDSETQPFWEGCRAGKLTTAALHASAATSASRRRASAPNADRPSANGSRAQGDGKVFSWIVVRHPVPRDVYAQDVPYVVALIELDEGVRIPSNIVGCAPEDVTAGMPVTCRLPAT